MGQLEDANHLMDSASGSLSQCGPLPGGPLSNYHTCFYCRVATPDFGSGSRETPEERARGHAGSTWDKLICVVADATE